MDEDIEQERTSKGPDPELEPLACDSEYVIQMKILVRLIEGRVQDKDHNSRVQLAYDLVYIAACERIRRLLGSDVGAPQD